MRNPFHVLLDAGTIRIGNPLDGQLVRAGLALAVRAHEHTVGPRLRHDRLDGAVTDFVHVVVLPPQAGARHFEVGVEIAAQIDRMALALPPLHRVLVHVPAARLGVARLQPVLFAPHLRPRLPRRDVRDDAQLVGAGLAGLVRGHHHPVLPGRFQLHLDSRVVRAVVVVVLFHQGAARCEQHDHRIESVRRAQVDGHAVSRRAPEHVRVAVPAVLQPLVAPRQRALDRAVEQFPDLRHPRVQQQRVPARAPWLEGRDAGRPAAGLRHRDLQPRPARVALVVVVRPDGPGRRLDGQLRVEVLRPQIGHEGLTGACVERVGVE